MGTSRQAPQTNVRPASRPTTFFGSLRYDLRAAKKRRHVRRKARTEQDEARIRRYQKNLNKELLQDYHAWTERYGVVVKQPSEAELLFFLNRRINEGYGRKYPQLMFSTANLVYAILSLIVKTLLLIAIVQGTVGVLEDARGLIFCAGLSLLATAMIRWPIRWKILAGLWVLATLAGGPDLLAGGRTARLALEDTLQLGLMLSFLLAFWSLVSSWVSTFRGIWIAADGRACLRAWQEGNPIRVPEMNTEQAFARCERKRKQFIAALIPTVGFAGWYLLIMNGREQPAAAAFLLALLFGMLAYYSLNQYNAASKYYEQRTKDFYREQYEKELAEQKGR